MPIFQTVAAACRAAGEKLRSWKQKKRTDRLWRVVLWGILWAMLCPTLGACGAQREELFLSEKESIAYGDGSYVAESDVEDTDQNREAETNAGNTDQNREVESNAGDTDQNRKAEPSAEAQTGQSSPMLLQRKQKPLWCTSAEQYPLRGSMSFRQAAEL